MSLPVPQKRIVGAAGSSLGLSGLVGAGSLSKETEFQGAILELFDVQSTSYPLEALTTHNGNLISGGRYSTTRQIHYHDGMTSSVLSSVVAPSDFHDFCVIGDELFAHRDDGGIAIYTIANGVLTYDRILPRNVVYCRGLTTDGTDLFTMDYAGGTANNGQIVRLDPADGAILEELPFPGVLSTFSVLEMIDGNLLTMDPTLPGIFQLREGLTTTVLDTFTGLEDENENRFTCMAYDPIGGDMYLGQSNRTQYSHVTRRFGVNGVRNVASHNYYAPAGAKKNWRVVLSSPDKTFIGMENLEFRETAGGANQTPFVDATERATASSMRFNNPTAYAFFTGVSNQYWLSDNGDNLSIWIAWRFDDLKLINEIYFTQQPSVSALVQSLVVQSSGDGGVTWENEWFEPAITQTINAAITLTRP